jgi:D-3-phosphoglycerate dehydrogenase
MPRILVTPRSLTATPHPAVEALRQRGHEVVYCQAGKMPDESELLRLVPGVAGWLAGVETVTPAVIAAATELRAISRNGVGVDNLPLPLLAERGIAVRVAQGANAPGVAELALGLMLAALRHIPQADHGIKQGQWPRQIGRELRGRKVGVVGCGAIGSEVARLCHALGAQPLAYDVAGGVAARLPFAQAVDFATLLAQAEIITLHCPAPAGGAALLGPREFAAMRRGAALINTARAALVDEAALESALDDGRLACYAADAFHEEPPRNLALVNDPRVIATSHIGGYTEESVDRSTTITVANLLDALGNAALAQASRR